VRYALTHWQAVTSWGEIKTFEFTSNGGGEKAFSRLVKRSKVTYYEVIIIQVNYEV